MNNNQPKTKFFGYLRKSSEPSERQAFSIPAQKAEIQKRFPDVDIEFVEESKSAFTPYNRPLLVDMLNRIRKGERCGLVAWHPDRLSRNEIDAAAITYMIRTGEIKELKFGAYNFDNTPEGIWMLEMALSQSQYDSAKKGRDVKRGLEQKARMGSFPAGQLPEGYDRDRSGGKGNTKIISLPGLPLLKRAMQLMLTGNHSPLKIRDLLNDEWGFRTKKGRKLCRTTIYNLFTNPFYFGDFSWNGISYHGTHEKIITPEEYDHIQALLNRRGRARSKKHMIVFAGGMIRCGECGGGITGEEKIKHLKSGKINRFIYYHCTKRKYPDCSQNVLKKKN